MKEFICSKCGSIDTYIKENGSQTGLYCGDCGKWIKWLGIEDKRLFEHWQDDIKNNGLIKLTKNDINNLQIAIGNAQAYIDCVKEILGMNIR
jgi:transcription elongation factor Elf1